MHRFTIAEEPADCDDVRWCFGPYYHELGTDFGYDGKRRRQTDDRLPHHRRPASAGRDA